METFAQKIQLFYDGTNIETYGVLPGITGFTTNTSFMVQGGELDVPSFYQKVQPIVSDRPISLQLWSSDPEKMIEDAYKLTSYGPNVYVKIPIINESGESNIGPIMVLAKARVKVNVTAIFTLCQVIDLYQQLKEEDVNTPMIVSVFAGRISDTAVDPKPIVHAVCQLFKSIPSVQILWAGCKETLSIQHAIDVGCHMITIPDSILDRIGRVGKDLEQFSKETVKAFQKDGQRLSL